MNPIVTLRHVAVLLPFLTEGLILPRSLGLAIEPHKSKGCLLIATNGYAMGIIHDEAATADKSVVWKPSRALRAACETYLPSIDPLSGDDVESDIDGEMVELVSPTWGEVLSDEFVDWRKALPEVIKGHGTPLQPSVAAAFDSVARFNAVQLSITPFGGKKGDGRPNPAYVFSPNLPRFMGAIMPMKVVEGTNDLKELPDWLKA